MGLEFMFFFNIFFSLFLLCYHIVTLGFADTQHACKSVIAVKTYLKKQNISLLKDRQTGKVTLEFMI